MRFLDQLSSDENKAQIVMNIWSADYLDPHGVLQTSRFKELSGWKNDEYRALLEKAEQEGDYGRRLELYKQADILIVQEAAILPLTYSKRPILKKPWVRSFPVSPDNTLRLRDAIIEPH